MKKIYGYCRISQRKQSIERQIRNIKARYPDAIIVQEAYTGTKFDGRKAYEALLKQIRKEIAEGIEVLLVFDSVSRMSRNEAEGFAEYQALYQMGIQLEFIKEPYVNTEIYKESAQRQIEAVKTGDEATDEFMQAMANAINRYIMSLAEKQIKVAFQQAEKEVQDLHQRTKEGLETARMQGRVGGLKKGAKITVKKAEPAKEIIRKHCRDFEGTLTDAECMKLAGIARNTYYKYKAEIKQGM